MRLLNMLHINMKKCSVGYIPKINVVSSVEFMKNTAKVKWLFKKTRHEKHGKTREIFLLHYFLLGEL